MAPSLDYRIEILATLLRIQIDGLRSFYTEGEERFVFKFDELSAKNDQLTGHDKDLYEDLHITEREGLEYLRDLKRQFAAVGLFNVFETFLRNTLDHLRDSNVPVQIPKPGERLYLDKMKGMFAAIHVPITEPSRDWNEIKKLQVIRNCISHLDGLPDAETVRKLSGYNFVVREGEWMELPPGYFEQTADLVQRVGKRIVEDCRAKYP